MRKLEMLSEQEIEFIVDCIQTYQTTQYYKEDRDSEIIDSIIDKL
jgi:hypothetical protein